MSTKIIYPEIFARPNFIVTYVLLLATLLADLSFVIEGS